MKIVPLDTFPNEMEAQLAAQVLQGEGVPVVVKPLGGGYGVFGVTPFIHHRVYVPEDMLERAREVLQAGPEPEPEPDATG